MLAKVAPPTNDFAALARYLVLGKERPTNPKRVAWIRTQNLGTDDPELAAAFMQATAALSKRTRNAAYHLMIAWHERERPTPEIMQEIALKTLALSGLAEHQVLVMGHGDKPHRHLHMMINRVHPDTGRAWKHSHDYARFDAIMRQLSDEYGFEHVPAHVYNPDLTDDLPKKPNSPATWAGKRGANTHRSQWRRKASRDLGAKISERLNRAAGWDDVEAAFAEEGLTLEAKGQGLVVGTPTSYSKFSALGLATTAHDLEKRFQNPLRVFRVESQRAHRGVFTVDAVDILKALVAWGLADRSDVHTAVQDVHDQRLARLQLREHLLVDVGTVLAGTTAHTQPMPKILSRRPPHTKPRRDIPDR